MMKPMKNDYGKPTLLNEQDLGVLLEDLLDISNSSNFGSKFEVLLAEPERFEKLVFRISSSIMKQGVKIIVVMQEYPASKFELLPTNDPICIELIQLANDDLRNKKRKIRLLDILNSLTEAIKKIELKREDISGESDIQVSRKASFNLFSKIFPQKQNTNNLDKVQNDEGKSINKTINPETMHEVKDDNKTVTVSTDLSKLANRVNSKDLFSTIIKKVIWPRSIYKSILGDYSKYRPNEFAFICSGYFLNNGIVRIISYYSGKMRISNPGYCELTDKFIETTIYSDIPREDDLIVWGHVHPIDGPSGIDSNSFKEISKWDLEVFKSGHLLKRSIALLINSNNERALFFDLHSSRQIPSSFENELKEGNNATFF